MHRAASLTRRALRLAVAVVGAGAVVLGAGSTGAAQPADTVERAAPVCAPAVADLPLSVAVAFSGTVRAVVDDDGAVVERSLRCAYGDGAEPAIDLRATWAPRGSCGTVTARRADGVAAAAVDRAAAALEDALGGPCPGVAATSVPWPAVGLVGAAVLAGTAAVVVARRRRSSAPPSDPDPLPVTDPLSVPPTPVPPSTPTPDAVVGALVGRDATVAARRPVGLLALAGVAAARRGADDVVRRTLAAARASEEVRLPAGRMLQDLTRRVTRGEEEGP